VIHIPKYHAASKTSVQTSEGIFPMRQGVFPPWVQTRGIFPGSDGCAKGFSLAVLRRKRFIKFSLKDERIPFRILALYTLA
jgi:hypothetical protein